MLRVSIPSLRQVQATPNACDPTQRPRRRQVFVRVLPLSIVQMRQQARQPWWQASLQAVYVSYLCSWGHCGRGRRNTAREACSPLQGPMYMSAILDSVARFCEPNSSYCAGFASLRSLRLCGKHSSHLFPNKLSKIFLFLTIQSIPSETMITEWDSIDA